jgi:hypothetical protein
LSQHLLFVLSSHGFGHLGQVTPVIRALRTRRPELRITVRSRLPKFKLREKLGRDVAVQEAELDIGVIQKDALNIDLDVTAQRYREFHRRWTELLAREERVLHDIRPDLVIANIPYLPLTAAQRLGIPNIAFCSLNWAEIYQHFFAGHAGSAAILEQMLGAYNGAACFLQPAPSMRMPGINNAIAIGPVAQLGNDVRGELRSRLGLDADQTLVLFSVGGMAISTPCDRWPRVPGLHLLVPESWNSEHPDTSSLEALDYPFADLLRSCDVLIAKPGYGSFVEAACTGTPVLYLPRPGWPEAPVLIDWLQRHGRCSELSHADFRAGRLEAPVRQLRAQAAPDRVTPDGVEQAADAICRYL